MYDNNPISRTQPYITRGTPGYITTVFRYNETDENHKRARVAEVVEENLPVKRQRNNQKSITVFSENRSNTPVVLGALPSGNATHLAPYTPQSFLHALQEPDPDISVPIHPVQTIPLPAGPVQTAPVVAPKSALAVQEDDILYLMHLDLHEYIHFPIISGDIAYDNSNNGYPILSTKNFHKLIIQAQLTPTGKTAYELGQIFNSYINVISDAIKRNLEISQTNYPLMSRTIFPLENITEDLRLLQLKVNDYEMSCVFQFKLKEDVTWDSGKLCAAYDIQLGGYPLKKGIILVDKKAPHLATKLYLQARHKERHKETAITSIISQQDWFNSIL